MEIRIADIIEESFVDGDGIRFTIFVQGCPHHCKGCHNPMTHDFNGGKIVDTEDLIAMFTKPSLINGITLSGGEPLCQIDAATEIAYAAKYANLSVWCYTGYIYENLINQNSCDTNFFTFDKMMNFLDYIDVLVDGPFLLKQRDLTMQFCGSRNQRLIDVRKTQAANKIILWSLA